MNIPNLITLGRILLVPVVVWAIASGAMWIAFVLFVIILLWTLVQLRLQRRTA